MTLCNHDRTKWALPNEWDRCRMDLDPIEECPRHQGRRHPKVSGHPHKEYIPTKVLHPRPDTAPGLAMVTDLSTQRGKALALRTMTYLTATATTAPLRPIPLMICRTSTLFPAMDPRVPWIYICVPAVYQMVQVPVRNNQDSTYLVPNLSRTSVMARTQSSRCPGMRHQCLHCHLVSSAALQVSRCRCVAPVPPASLLVPQA